MTLVAREEGNLRAAIRRAFQRGERQVAWRMADTLRGYLGRAGRLRERDALATWVRKQWPVDTKLDEAACAVIRQHAESRFTQSQMVEAVRAIQDLIDRLEDDGLADDEDPGFQLALSYHYLGRIYVNASQSDLALEPLNRAIAYFERLGDPQRGNLAAALGNLADAQRDQGYLDTALQTAERVLEINRQLGHDFAIGGDLGRIARILTKQQRYTEAESRYAEALCAAQDTGDLQLQAIALHQLGILKDTLGQHDQAIELYKRSLNLFQHAGDPRSEIKTYDLLGTAEQHRGQLDAAEAWYHRSRELAKRLDDKWMLAVTAQNLGILFQVRALQAEDPAVRATLLGQAIGFVEECLAAMLEQKDTVSAAGSYSQLGVLHGLLGNPKRAEKYLLQGLDIYESLDLPDAYRNYADLARIAHDRGDAEAAARWQAKYEAKVAELKQRRRGNSGGNASPTTAQ